MILIDTPGQVSARWAGDAGCASATGRSSEEPVLSPGPTDTWEQSFVVCGCSWPPGICYCQSRRRKDTQSQAEGVNPSPRSSRSLQETPGVAPNKPQRSTDQYPKGRRQFAAAVETDPESWLYKQSFRGSSRHTSLKGCHLGEPPF